MSVRLNVSPHGAVTLWSLCIKPSSNLNKKCHYKSLFVTKIETHNAMHHVRVELETYSPQCLTGIIQLNLR